jgi:hypothetical protein
MRIKTMLEIIISVCIFLAGGVVGWYVGSKQTTINNIKQEQVQQVENKTTVFVVQGQITIVDTKTNLNLNVKDLSNIIFSFIKTNYFITNYTN